MPLFWNKKIEADRTIYWRSKKQKTAVYALGISGGVIVLGMPYFIGSIPPIKHLILTSTPWEYFFAGVGWLGLALLIVAAIGRWAMNIKVMNATRSGRKIRVDDLTKGGDTIIIYD